MWNISAISAADSSRGSAKKLRENTSKARCRAVAGKPRVSRKSWALTSSRRAWTPRVLTSSRGRAAAGRRASRSRSPKLGLSATKPSALSGGVRGMRRNPSDNPLLCRNG